mmetsp:Transcript_7754/g.14617  ORF Transcript_7754/g.14617 Transcript_7754/m.14617 type:complete len:614 (+) Transcript_7754:167-2008(+)|eukprot:CAMPEP_0114253056 /NCGR_PEP_ID=MMETSP0058-20121206/16183_1 /TAXON_ID=36894 /ORGANISM="Pyramimonas parkeae, CCMP726" /LENGTH=613 /DNA_ID=CAMNT_0001367065 /DNA_START=166 /DNA_END=2004 /DNA_ORIENTATION=-
MKCHSTEQEFEPVLSSVPSGSELVHELSSEYAPSLQATFTMEFQDYGTNDMAKNGCHVWSDNSQQLAERAQSSSSSGSKPRAKRLFKNCEVAGCVKFSRGSTMRCVAHGGGRRCSIRGCARAARGREGVCIGHGGGKRCAQPRCTKSAIDRSDLCIAHGGGRQCREDGCYRIAQVPGGLCIFHGGGMQCQYEGCPKSAMQGSNKFCRTHKATRLCDFLFCSNYASHYGYCKLHWVSDNIEAPQCSTMSRRSSTGSNPITDVTAGLDLCATTGTKKMQEVGKGVWSEDGVQHHQQWLNERGSHDFAEQVDGPALTAVNESSLSAPIAADREMWFPQSLPSTFIDMCRSSTILEDKRDSQLVGNLNTVPVTSRSLNVDLADLQGEPDVVCPRDTWSGIQISKVEFQGMKSLNSLVMEVPEAFKIEYSRLQHGPYSCPTLPKEVHTCASAAAQDALSEDSSASQVLCSHIDQETTSTLFSHLLLHGEQCQGHSVSRSISYCGSTPVSTMHDPLPRRAHSSHAEHAIEFFSRRDGAPHGVSETIALQDTLECFGMNHGWVATSGEQSLIAGAVMETNGNLLTGEASTSKNSVAELAKELEAPEMRQAFMEELELSGW